MLATLNYVRSGDLPSFLSVLVTFNLRKEWILSVDSGFGEFSLCVLEMLSPPARRDRHPAGRLGLQVLFREGLETISR